MLETGEEAAEGVHKGKEGRVEVSAELQTDKPAYEVAVEFSVGFVHDVLGHGASFPGT